MVKSQLEPKLPSLVLALSTAGQSCNVLQILTSQFLSPLSGSLDSTNHKDDNNSNAFVVCMLCAGHSAMFYVHYLTDFTCTHTYTHIQAYTQRDRLLSTWGAMGCQGS